MRAMTVAEYTRDDELDLSDIVAAARLSGMIPGTGRFSRAILGAGYRRTEDPSPDWDLREQFADQGGHKHVWQNGKCVAGNCPNCCYCIPGGSGGHPRTVPRCPELATPHTGSSPSVVPRG